MNEELPELVQVSGVHLTNIPWVPDLGSCSALIFVAL